MILPKRSALNIVSEISGVIGEKVNMMDSDGIIVASSDPARINTFHEGAKRLIDENLEELVVHYDGEFRGARQGTNLPIMFEGEIVGVIGVTGPYKKIRKYGQIIKKMTEILMLDIAMSERVNIESRAKSRFLGEWLHASQQEVTQSMVDGGLKLNIDITIPRRVMLVSVIPNVLSDASKPQLTVDRAEKEIQKVLQCDGVSVVFRSDSYLVCLIAADSDEQMLSLSSLLKHDVEKVEDVLLVIGIDSAINGYQQIKAAFARAEKAFKACLRSRDKLPRLYGSLNMEIFSGELADLTKIEYVRRIFRGCTADEVAEWIAMLEVYYECDGSITETAARLHIHKNTLQYRLKGLSAITGYDPRSIKFSSLYYNAIHFYRDINHKIQDIPVI